MNGTFDTKSSSSPGRMAQLAGTIARCTELIESHLRERGQPLPSLDWDAPSTLPIDPAAFDVSRARLELVDASEEMRMLAMGSRETVRFMSWDHNNTLSLQAVYRYGLAKCFAPGARISYAALAERTGLPELTTRRLVRHAMCNRIFRETDDGQVEHTTASATLRKEEGLDAWIGMHTEDLFPSVPRTLDAVEKWKDSEESNHCSLSLVNNSEDSYFAILNKEPYRVARFGKAMQGWAEGEGNTMDFFVHGWDWAKLGNGTVVDCGGSLGFASMSLARSYPNLKFIVQDLPEVAENARKQTLPAELQGRLEFMAHDFFQDQPVHGADVYFFRWVFHNWSDKYAVQMLQRLVPALKPGAKVIINDIVLPDPGTGNNYEEKVGRTMDLVMLATLNAKSREIDQWRTIFDRADSRYRFLGASRPKGSRMWAVEAAWDPSGALDAASGAIDPGELRV